MLSHNSWLSGRAITDPLREVTGSNSIEQINLICFVIASAHIVLPIAYSCSASGIFAASISTARVYFLFLGRMTLYLAMGRKKCRPPRNSNLFLRTLQHLSSYERGAKRESRLSTTPSPAGGGLYKDSCPTTLFLPENVASTCSHPPKF
jgi:hypothetical protein